MLNSYTKAKQTVLEEIDDEKAQLIWSDHYYGMSNSSSLVSWVNAAQEGVFEGSSDFLRDLFSLNIVEMSSILSKLKTTIQGV